MLTRLKISGFKNLVGADLRFGPFTCIAGANGVGKSNVFDAIRFLSASAGHTLTEAALAVRRGSGTASDVGGIFHRVADERDEEIDLLAEMVVPPSAVDDLGQLARASTTFLKYHLVVRLRGRRPMDSGGNLEIVREELTHVTQGNARAHLKFAHSARWRRSVVTGRRTSPFISTDSGQTATHIKLHQDRTSGRPKVFLASSLPRTVLSSANAAESPTALVARRELASWSLLQLEPSALRAPDEFTAPSHVATNGAHMAATLARLSRVHPEELDEEFDAAVCARVANRLAELIGDVRSVEVFRDEKRERYTVLLRDRQRTPHEARYLSDGTLRFLALAIIENDPDAQGVLCFEEPENGIHPDRIQAMLDLLQELATATDLEIDADNPLRQVIVNTHSPSVVALVPDDSLVVATAEPWSTQGRHFTRATFRALTGTWRTGGESPTSVVSPGRLLSYLGRPRARRPRDGAPSRCVVDRPELARQLDLHMPEAGS